MKLWMLLSLLLLSILIDEAQGIRFIKGSISERHHDIHETISEKKHKLDGVEDVNLCKGKQCPSSGRIRKLTMTTTSRTTTNLKNDKKDQLEKVGKPEENLSANSSSSKKTKSEQPRPVSQPYPDVLDLAGMDYSQARRKPPIHN